MLENFTEEDVEDVLISSFQKGSNFTILVDSISVPKRKYHSTSSIISPIEMKAELDYTLYFKTLGATYKIDNIQTHLVECNTCVLSTDNHLQLLSYELNDEQIELDYFKITK